MNYRSNKSSYLNTMWLSLISWNRVLHFKGPNNQYSNVKCKYLLILDVSLYFPFENSPVTFAVRIIKTKQRTIFFSQVVLQWIKYNIIKTTAKATTRLLLYNFIPTSLTERWFYFGNYNRKALVKLLVFARLWSLVAVKPNPTLVSPLCPGPTAARPARKDC